ncbi:MAG: SDR family oxidoreductase [Bermanella sp.]
MKQFKNKVVVITGAGSGMGRAYALAFAKLGSKIAISDVDTVGLKETQAMVEALPHNGIYSEQLDVGQKDAIFTFAKKVKKALGNTHVVINNAGVGGGGVPTWSMSPEQYERTMRINLFGVIYGTQAFLPQMIENNEGAVINVSSIFGLVGTPDSSDYCAAKFAVRGFTESLMVELQESPISVHLVHPGGVKTNIVKDVEGGEEFSKKYLKTSPDDIAQYVIKCIKSGKPRIVCGNQSSIVWLISWAIPLKWRNLFLHMNMKDLINPVHYKLIKNANKP